MDEAHGGGGYSKLAVRVCVCIQSSIRGVCCCFVKFFLHTLVAIVIVAVVIAAWVASLFHATLSWSISFFMSVCVCVCSPLMATIRDYLPMRSPRMRVVGLLAVNLLQYYS